MSLVEWLGILAGVVSLLGYLPYIYSILLLKTQPSRSSWWIWSLVGFLILISYYSSGARNTIWVPVIFVIFPLVIATLSIKYGQNAHMDRIDKVCLSLAIASIVIWLISRDAVTALYINIFIDFLGFMPTIKKTFYYPQNESRATWIIFLIGSLFNLFAVDSLHLNIIMYPVYMMVMDIIMVGLLFRKKINLQITTYASR